jgi:hypothetical protein
MMSKEARGTAPWVMRVEVLLAGLAGVLGAVTLFWRDWIEVLTGWDPDRHSGYFEWTIAVGLLLLAVSLASLAKHQATANARLRSA